MFFQHVKQEWEKGKVTVSLPTQGCASSASFEGAGITSLAIKCLSKSERKQLTELAKQDAITKRDAGSRPQVLRKDIIQKLTGYEYVEILHAFEILSESDSDVLELEEVRNVWDRVSVTLDHHMSENNDLSDLQKIESELARAGRFGGDLPATLSAAELAAKDNPELPIEFIISTLEARDEIDRGEVFPYKR